MKVSRICSAVVALVSVCSVMPTTPTHAQAGPPQLVIFASAQDRSAAEYLRAILEKTSGRKSSITLVDAGPDSFEAATRSLGWHKQQRQPSVAVIRWAEPSHIPETLRAKPDGAVMLGPAPPVKVHLVSRARYGMRVSDDPSQAGSLQNRTYGLGWKSSPTEEDALNLFKAVKTYPCPKGSSCKNYTSSQQIQLLLSDSIHAFFLTAECPAPSVEYLQDQLRDDFYLVEIPSGVVQKMATSGKKPYLLALFDPNECRYPAKQGTIETAGVSRAYVGSAGLADTTALDIARALVELPPFDKGIFGSTLPKLQFVFPFHPATRAVYSQWLK